MSNETCMDAMDLGDDPEMADCVHDLIHDLGCRLDRLWQYDQYIANSNDHAGVIAFWRVCKAQEYRSIESLKHAIRQHVQNAVF